MAKKIILIVTGTVLIATSFYLGWYFSSKKVQADRILLEKAEKQFAPKPTTNIRGEITKIDGKTITIRRVTADPLYNPFDTSPETREIKISDSTTLEKKFPRTLDEYNKAKADFREEVIADVDKALSEPLPSLAYKKGISFSDLKVGDYVDVITKKPFNDETVLNDVKSVTVQLQTPWFYGEKVPPWATAPKK